MALKRKPKPDVTKDKPLDEDGREVLDGTPMAPPIGYQKQPSMVDHIRNLIRSEALAKAAQDADAETFEEADDFDVDDELDDPRTPYEAIFDPPATPLPGELSEPPQRTPPPPETQSEDRRDEEKAPAAPDPTPESGSKAPPPPSKPPRPPNTSPKRSV